ncbi:MAG TPA: alpha/beta hydrolase family protein [Candidatus Sulfotelmatobacter sp.]|nr:alpha/beta hydrolase family protein [Candidatus Sulfotelmatobacter sp.]
MSRIHPLDVIAASLSSWQKLFSRGWGDEQLLRHLVQDAAFAGPLPAICIDWFVTGRQDGMVWRDGTFCSPLDLLPTQARTVHVRAWSKRGNAAACVILAASRDEGYKTRERVFCSLVHRGFDLYLIENPFYGRRRTSSTASLSTFSDHVLMNVGSVQEARALLEYLRGFYEQLTVTGYSMGGHMAALTAVSCPFPVACAALATGASAAPIYTKGLLSWSVNLEALAAKQGQRLAAKERLRLLIETADLTRHPPPIRSDAAFIVGCASDGYVLANEVERLHEHWTGSTLRWLPAGHVTGLFFFGSALRDAVADATTKLSAHVNADCAG